MSGSRIVAAILLVGRAGVAVGRPGFLSFANASAPRESLPGAGDPQGSGTARLAFAITTLLREERIHSVFSNSPFFPDETCRAIVGIPGVPPR